MKAKDIAIKKAMGKDPEDDCKRTKDTNRRIYSVSL